MRILRKIVSAWRSLWQGSDFGKEHEFGAGDYGEGDDTKGTYGVGGV